MKHLRFPALFLFLSSLFLLPLFAGGPIGGIGDVSTKYAAASLPLRYKTDRGSLGSFNNTQATEIAVFAFTEWDNLATADLSFSHLGQLDYDVVSASDPYISGLEQFGDGVFPVVFDTDGAITDSRIGAGARQQVYGFASSFSPDGVHFQEGFVIINGFLTGRPDVDPVYREVITHEVGHMLGLSHSQVALGADYSLMYPTTQAQAATGIEADDAAAMSALYPAPGYLNSVGSITGRITNNLGEPLSGVNVIAVDSATGDIYSSVSDYFSGDDPRFVSNPGRIGTYTIRGLPPGRYFVRIEPINPLFVTGSQVASYLTPINTDIWHEWYNGENEDGNMLLDNSNERTSVAVSAGGVTEGIDIAANGSPTLSALTEHSGTASQEIPLPLQANVGVTITQFAVRYTAPGNGSLLGVRLWTQANSDMPENSTLTVTVHRDVAGSIAGIPGQALGSVTIPFSQLAGDQYNDIWLRDLGNGVNFFQGEKFHVSVRINGGGSLVLLLDDANGSRNQTSYFVQEANMWQNFPDGLSGPGVAAWNLLMSAIYTSVPAGVQAPLADAPSQLAFGSARVGVKATKQMTFRNVGTADMNVTNVLITGTNGPRFSLESGGGAFTLEPGESRTVTVGFTPQERTAVTALLQFVHNASGSPTVVNLSGTGTEPVVVMAASSIDFGERTVNLLAQQEPVIFRNGGLDSLRVLGVEVEGEGFTLSSPGGATWVAPAGSFKSRVTFRPVEEKSYSGTLRIYHELTSSPIEIPLSGVGKISVGSVSTQFTASGLSVSLDPVRPNPVRDGAEIVWQTSGSGRLPVEIVLADITGRTVLRRELEVIGTGGTAEERLPVDVGDLSSGEYQVTIRSAHGTATQKFVIVR